MTGAADITARRCGAPVAGRWCVLRSGHATSRGTGHRANPRIPVEAAAARAFAARAGAREPPPYRGPAACREEDPELFFPAQPGSAQERLAKAICRRCQIREECLLWALGHPGQAGIWGGASEDERAEMLGGTPASIESDAA
jgi:WhiB family redox-sensing transcriptional regulator